MAPTIPSSTRPRTRLTRSARPTTTPHRETPTTSTSLLGHSSKRDKRTIKHSALLSRISKSHPSSKVNKRRRPSKKLVANLDSLADALPDAPVAEKKGREGGVQNGVVEGEQVRIRHKSLGSRPGRAKRREKEVKGERERFGVNLARMMGGGGESKGGEEGKSAERWKALRGFIEGTMERRAEGGD